MEYNRERNESNYKRERRGCALKEVTGSLRGVSWGRHMEWGVGGLHLTQSQWRRFCGAGRLLSADSSGSSAELDLQLG